MDDFKKFIEDLGFANFFAVCLIVLTVVTCLIFYGIKNFNKTQAPDAPEPKKVEQVKNNQVQKKEAERSKQNVEQTKQSTVEQEHTSTQNYADNAPKQQPVPQSNSVNTSQKKPNEGPVITTKEEYDAWMKGLEDKRNKSNNNNNLNQQKQETEKYNNSPEGRYKNAQEDLF